MQTILSDWLQGAFTTDSLAAALADRDKSAPGQCLVAKDGHVITRASVSFTHKTASRRVCSPVHRKIENLDKQIRAQALIADEAKAGLTRASSAYANAQQQLAQTRAQAAEAQTRAHDMKVDVLRLTQAAEQAPDSAQPN